MNEALGKLRHWLIEKGLQGVVLTQEASIAWLFGGRYHIAIATELACVSVLVARDATEALVNNIEAQRLQDEEGLAVDQVRIYPWYDEAARLNWLTRWLAVQGVVEESLVGSEIQSLRLTFDKNQIHLLRDLGKSVAGALYQTSIGLRPDVSEYDAAGALAAQCMSRGIEPIVNLVAGSRRAHLYRHLLPTFEPLGRYAVLSVSGRRAGLVVSASRMVHFGPAEKEFLIKYRAVLQVEAALVHASVVGASLGDALMSGINAYVENGFPDEWKQHHQGGLGGYLPREVRATIGHPMRIEPGMLLSWNPTIRGVKAEDSVLVREDGVEWLTVDEGFPTVSVNNGRFYLPEAMQL